jgi:hypothetical protein
VIIEAALVAEDFYIGVEGFDEVAYAVFDDGRKEYLSTVP